MSQAYRHIVVQQHSTVGCVRLVKPRLDETEIYQLFGELLHLARDGGCPHIALSLGPQPPNCMYSIFLAKLIGLERRLREMGGGLKLCECPQEVIDILDAVVLLDRFELVPDPDTAVRQWQG
jgi:hypothetical protein